MGELCKLSLERENVLSFMSEKRGVCVGFINIVREGLLIMYNMVC